ncbi:hypothetical protein HMPREF9182_0974 [Streptococcus sp. oral taxon 056 str. F0418]|uniref:hypothetical protein n=1 Tax=Streptococcus sp. oral taxon 056 TaxID=712620 RepID=UPI00021812A8|nr:hypothetical protein [Streptococcus sp. oral taxon 056]EGP65778.1 hypothetical protein HMPREF9182_0974 [Streptococcus sp. oral taxon 056 str. F0418]
MNKIMLEQSFTNLTELELANVGGGRIVWNGQINAEMHKVIDSSGNFLSRVYNAGRSFGRNFYNAFF